MEKYISSQNAEIFVNQFIVPNSTKAIVLIHGLAEHSGRYNKFIEELNKNAYSVFAMDLRGHGLTISKRGDCESISKVLADVDKVISFIKSPYSLKHIGIFGHSVGGLVAALYQSIYKNVDSLILSSPLVYCPKKLKIIRFVPYKMLPFIYIKKRHSESQEMLEFSKKDKLALHSFSIRTVGVFFKEGIKLLNEKLNILCPTLLVYGKQDVLLNEEYNFENFISKLTNPQNKLIAYENAKHRIVNNKGAAERISDIIKWLNIIS